LKEILSEENKPEYIFQLNFMDNNFIIRYLKKIFKCKILTVVHYTNWSFEFLGDIGKMKKLHNTNPKELKTPMEKAVMKSVKNDLSILEHSDSVVFVALHTYQSFQGLGLKQQNIEIINNSIKDIYKSIHEKEKRRLKQKFFIGQSERIIIFAGRLDAVKGIGFLIAAFKKIVYDHPDTRLFIAGDGNFNELMKEAASCWSKISFTGRLEKKALYELYSIADIGVVCSLHEEFGLVAIEMMMHALPVVVTKTSGLDEIVEDGVSGLKVPVVKKRVCES
jgi:glycosyltransferase